MTLFSMKTDFYLNIFIDEGKEKELVYHIMAY